MIDPHLVPKKVSISIALYTSISHGKRHHNLRGSTVMALVQYARILNASNNFII